MKTYKQKIKYHNLQGDFPKGTTWEERSTAYWSSNVYLPKDFVEKNPDIFELDYTKLLEEVHKRYPIGTKYISISPDTLGIKSTVRGRFMCVSTTKGLVKITDGYWGSVYYDGKWAEIVKEPLFTTEDGVDIYEGDEYWVIFIYYEPKRLIGVSTIKYTKEGKKRFSTKEKAQEYLDLNKPQYSKQDIMDAIRNGKNNLGPKRVHSADEIIKLIFRELGKNE